MAVLSEVIDARRQSKTVERMFYTGMAIAILAVVFAGFSRTWFLRPYFPQPQALIPILVLHGLIFSSWIALFVTQTSLIAAWRTRTHMRLGMAGMVLAGAMVIVGTVTALIRAKGPSPIPGVNPLSFLTIPLVDMIVFPVLVGAAFYFRKQVDMHKRLILLATIAILPAAVARLPFQFVATGGPPVFFGLADLFIVPCLIFDFVTRGRPHRATLLGALLIVASQPLRLMIGGTSAWLAIASWLTSWV
jgi:hypothetical protein